MKFNQSIKVRVSKDVFIENVKILKVEYLSLEPNFSNKNYELKLWELYKHCTIFYQDFWCRKNK
jgi:hypothetical protein